MTLSAELIRDYDELAASLGTTPKYNREGLVVPIGRPEGKGLIYGVYIGRGIGFYYNWGLCWAMVGGFPGACYKKYASLEEARMAWEQGPVRLRGKWRPHAPHPPQCTPGFEVDENEMYVVSPPALDTPPPSRVPPLPREVEVRLPSPLQLRVPSLGATADCSDDEEQMWRDAAWPDDPQRAGLEDPAPSPPLPLSPTISSISSLSLSPAPSLTSGTILPGPISTPVIPVASIPPRPTPKISTRTLSCPASDKAQTVRPIQRQESAGSATPPASPTKRTSRAIIDSPCSPPSSPTKKTRNPAGTSATSRGAAQTGTSRYTLERSDPVAVPKPKEVFVVVRGDFPGIYFDRNTAFVKLGVNPGMKLAVFSSLSKASWYFVQCYMSGKVGVPVVVVADSDD